LCGPGAAAAQPARVVVGAGHISSKPRRSGVGASTCIQECRGVRGEGSGGGWASCACRCQRWTYRHQAREPQAGKARS
jgi:hypothetical protein